MYELELLEQFLKEKYETGSIDLGWDILELESYVIDSDAAWP